MTVRAAYPALRKGAAFEVGGNVPNYTVDGTSNPGGIVVGAAQTIDTATNVVGSKTVLTL